MARAHTDVYGQRITTDVMIDASIAIDCGAARIVMNLDEARQLLASLPGVIAEAETIAAQEKQA